MPLSCERPPTALKLASEWLFTRVDSHVSLEVSVLCEAFAADLATERFLASVSPKMNLEST